MQETAEQTVTSRYRPSSVPISTAADISQRPMWQ